MKHEFTSAEFQAALKSGDISIPKKGKGRGKAPAGAAIGHLLEQEEPASTIVKPKEKKPAKPEAPQLSQMKLWLRTMGIEFETEFRFHATRKFRADIAILKYRTLIEYDGIMSSKSRHTSVTGFSQDCTKKNLATIEGWKVLVYTVLNFEEFINDIKKLQNEQL